MATAWEPYQELFQGVIVCLHSDFRIGGLKPGETKAIRGKIYLMPADLTGSARHAIATTFPARNGPRPDAGIEPPAKKLIEFGWDEPDTSFSAARARTARADAVRWLRFSYHNQGRRGGVPENFTWLCWGRRRFSRGRDRAGHRRSRSDQAGPDSATISSAST